MALVVGTNSYISLADANTYFSNRLFSDEWAAKSDAVKTQSLVMSARHLDRMFEWEGQATDKDQPMAWPRDNLYTLNGALLDPSVVPQDVIDAQCELAYQWCQHDQLSPSASANTATDINSINGGVKKEDLGGMLIEYQSPINNPLAAAVFGVIKKMYPLVEMLVSPYITGRSGSISVRISI